MTTTTNIYADESMANLDIGAIMRIGHPDVAAGDTYIVERLTALRHELGRPLSIIDVGSGSGDLSARLARKLPDCTIIANDIEEAPLAQARAKLANFPNAKVVGEPFEEWQGHVDAVVSWGTHHHLAHDYLTKVVEILAPDGLLLIGDEFCPEYLTPSDQERLRQGDHTAVVDGYVFPDQQVLNTYRETGELPEWIRMMEEARRHTLWHWYKFVGDFAIAHNSWDVLIAELQIARDDLITSFEGEHKTSPFLLELELDRANIEILERKELGNRPEDLRSFVVFVARPRP